jgi:glycosyltransferase involved in cell wall biosynthesis/tetratricopeptide (TPR) repeat protein
MSHRYLFGPVQPSCAGRLPEHARRLGECLTFGPAGGTDLTVGPEVASWQDLCARLPAGFQPDFVVLNLAYTTVPVPLWSAPVPLVGLAGDPNLLFHGYRLLLPRCDCVLTDRAGVETLSRVGISQARSANLYGCAPSWLEQASDEAERDIDILFVGSLHPAVQRERLPWLGRLARLGRRRRVHIRFGVFGNDYHSLLRRSRIVFNRSIRGECNQRVFECTAAGALLFQERGNAEVGALLEDRQDCVYYGEDDLEDLLEHYLTHEDERRELAEAGRLRTRACSFPDLWESTVRDLECDWEEVVAHARGKKDLPDREFLLGRVWQLLGSQDLQGDPGLEADLEQALLREPGAEWLNALGVTRIRRAQGRGQVPGEVLELALACFSRAVELSPRHLVAGLNRVELLTALDRREPALREARRLLPALDQGSPVSETWNAPHFPTVFDHYRVEWERAAWVHAGHPDAEWEEKRVLLRWRLHTLLAELTGELGHFYEAALARPDLPVARAALGCALGRAGRTAEAVAHLRAAVANDPFDGAAARALFHALGEVGNAEAVRSLVEDRRLLAGAAPDVVPEEWFTGPTATEKGLVVVWEGPQAARSSLGLVNREICTRLIRAGHQLTLLPVGPPEEEIEDSPTLAALRRHFDRPPAGPVDVYIRHLFPARWSPPAQGHWVVMQAWEYGSLPREWIAPLTELADEVWVPSRFVRDCFVRSGVPTEVVRVVPLGVNIERFRPGLVPLSLRTRKRCKFLFVGGTIPRKGIDLLLQVYLRTFRRDDDVCLVIKDMGVSTCYQGQTAHEEIARLEEGGDVPEVEYLNRGLTEEEMARLYAACDCLVLPYRGEGFGLPIVEAMASGKPVIVTAHGPAADYCDERNGWLIPARLVRFPEARVGNLETVERPWLAEPDPATLAAALRQVFEHPEEARSRGEAGRTRAQAGLTWEHTTEVIEARLRDLSRQPVRRFRAYSSPGGTGDVRDVRRQRVSLCMIVRNEESNLPACLSSVAGLFDEMVVVDTGSTDRTREVAAGFGARVLDFPWQDSFAAARNESLRHAAGDWIFWMDADDRLDSDNAEKLRRLLAGLTDENAAYVMKCLCLPDSQTRTATVVDHVRLFRNHPQIRWRYRVHEQILMALREQRTDVRWADVVIHHVGYQDPSRREGKLRRDLRLLHLENADRPDDPFTLFNLGWTYHEAGRLEEAIPLLARSLERSHPSDSIVRKLYALLAQSHGRLGQHAEALAVCREGRAVYPEDTELLFEEGLLRERDDPDGAERCWLTLLETKPGAHFASIDPGLRSYKALHRLAVLYHQRGRYAEAESRWRQAVTEREDYVPAWLGLGELLLQQRRRQELEQVVEVLERLPQGGTEAAVLRARGLLEREEYESARILLEEVILRTPQIVLPRILLGRVLLREGKDVEAEQVLWDVLALDPDNSEARNHLAELRNRTRPVETSAVPGRAGNPH